VETLQQVIAEQYKRLGVKVTPKVEALEALNDRLSVSRDATYGDQGGHDFDAALSGRALTADPDAFLFWHSSQVRGGANLVGYRNADVDRALEAGRTACSSVDRKAAYAAMDRQLNEDQPMNFGVSQKTLLFANKRLHGLDPGPFGSYASPGHMWNVEQWWVKS
jgi:peptide/nickel transport system substrate-binding protein